MKILEIGDLVSCAQTRGIDTAQLEREISNVALALANAIGAELFDCNNQPGFGGYCASFRATHDSVPCPDDIDAADTSGAWTE